MNELEMIVPRPGMYVMTYHCENCHRGFTQMFSKGEVASQGECTHCGVHPNQLRGSSLPFRYDRIGRDKVGWMYDKRG
jgi:DNA-directed RNA polymerase subunit RPC12/RpoP